MSNVNSYSTIQEVGDHGPIYAETVTGRFPVEPLNTVSNLIFLFIIVYWLKKTRMDIRKYPMVVIGICILAVGFVGGIIYHATRSDNTWLVMDYMAIFFSIIVACVYLWHRITGNWFLVFLFAVIPALVLRLTVGVLIAQQKSFIAFAYVSQALLILVPIFVHCWLNRFRYVGVLFSALASFAVALLCRESDAMVGRYLPVGSHFLWHIFGGISAFLLFHYIYHTSSFFYKRRKVAEDLLPQKPEEGE